MKQEFTSFENNNSLIIIFAGWGMSADPFRQLRIEGCDIMTVWDYSVVNFDRSGRFFPAHFQSFQKG